MQQKNKQHVRIRRFGAHALCACALALVSSAQAQERPCTHTIGAVLSLSGMAESLGRTAPAAMQLALADVNAAAGKAGVAGCTLALDLRDAQSLGLRAVEQARQLVDDVRVPVIIGDYISSTTLDIMNVIATRKRVVLVSPGASSPKLTTLASQADDGGWFFRVIPSDTLQGVADAKFAKDLGANRLAVLFLNNEFGGNLLGEFRRTYEGLGGQLVSVVAMSPTQHSFNAEVRQALASKPDFLYLIAYPEQRGPVLKAWIENGGGSHFLLHGMEAADFADREYGAVFKGAYGVSPSVAQNPSSAYLNKQYPHISQSTRTYDSAAIVALAIAKAGRYEATAIRNAMRQVTLQGAEAVYAGPQGFAKALRLIADGKPVRYVGSSGAHRFDSRGDVASPYTLWQFNGSTAVERGAITADDLQSLRQR